MHGKLKVVVATVEEEDGKEGEEEGEEDQED